MDGILNANSLTRDDSNALFFSYDFTKRKVLNPDQRGESESRWRVKSAFQSSSTAYKQGIRTKVISVAKVSPKTIACAMGARNCS